MEENHHDYIEYRDVLRKVHENVSSRCSRMNGPQVLQSVGKTDLAKDVKTTQTQNQDGSAAADELDDFVAVAGGDSGFGPFRAGQDFEVAFDGDAASIEAQFTEKIGDGGVGLCAASLSVYGNGDGRLHL
jgi:hypothetical protein